MEEESYKNFKSFVGLFESEVDIKSRGIRRLASKRQNDADILNYSELLVIEKDVEKEIDKLNKYIDKNTNKIKLEPSALERIKIAKSNIKELYIRIKGNKTKKENLEIMKDENELSDQNVLKTKYEVELKNAKTEEERLGKELIEDSKKLPESQIAVMRYRIKDLDRELDRDRESLEQAQEEYDYQVNTYGDTGHPKQTRAKATISHAEERIEEIEEELRELKNSIIYNETRLNERQKTDINDRINELVKNQKVLPNQIIDINKKIKILSKSISKNKSIKAEQIKESLAILNAQLDILGINLKQYQKALPNIKSEIIGKLSSKKDKNVADHLHILWKKATL